MTLSSDFIEHLHQSTAQSLKNPRINGVGGGDINTAYRLQADGVDWFIKLNHASLTAMFSAEAAGLNELAAQHIITVPRVITHGCYRQQAYLILEYLPLSALRGDSARRLGKQLAALHRRRQAYFGWPIDNTIGSTAQCNGQYEDWCHFWQRQRLGKQLHLAADNGCGQTLFRRGEKLLEKVPLFFSDYHPHPSLLHGDLWGGNAAADHQGNPVIFDPACYYGDREADLAMTELFGGFSRDFYAAYDGEYPLDAGYATRKTLYNLYHILNHFNLFGSGYGQQALRMVERLLAEV